MSNETDITLPSEDILRTSAYVLFVLLQFIPYTIILRIIYTDTDTYEATVYRIIFNLGIADCVCLIFHCTALPFTLWQIPMKTWIVRVCGAFLNGFAWGTDHFSLMLAFNRFITFSLHPNTVQTIDKKSYKIWIICAYIWALVVAAWNLTPMSGVYYDWESLSWGYIYEESDYMKTVEISISVSQLVLAAIFYLLTIAKLVFIKSTYNTKMDFKNEIKLLVQAIIIGGFSVFVIIYWNVLYQSFDPSYADFLGNLMWIIQNGMNPYLYLAMNPRIRNSFKEYFACKMKRRTQQNQIILLPRTLSIVTVESKF